MLGTNGMARLENDFMEFIMEFITVDFLSPLKYTLAERIMKDEPPAPAKQKGEKECQTQKSVKGLQSGS